MTIKERLKRDLKLHRYNFGHLAEEANVSRVTISNILNAKHNPSLATAVRLSRAANRLTGLTTYQPLDFFIDIND